MYSIAGLALLMAIMLIKKKKDVFIRLDYQLLSGSWSEFPGILKGKGLLSTLPPPPKHHHQGMAGGHEFLLLYFLLPDDNCIS